MEETSNLKYIVFFAVLIIGTPAAYFSSLRFPFVEKLVFFLMIFFTARMVDINFVSRETFRLTSKGFEVGLVDISTLVILLLVLKRKKKHPLQTPPGTIPYFIYFALSALSIVNSSVILFSLFELWKMLRMYTFFWVIYNYFTDYDKFEELMWVLGLVTAYIFFEVMKQKYGLGKFQSWGPFPHQNSLVMYSIILGAIFLSYVLNRKGLNSQQIAIWLLAFSMVSISVISTLSRAGMVLYGISTVIVLGLSLLSGIDARKAMVGVLLLFISLGVLARAWNSISERFRTAPDESAMVRQSLAKAAMKMVKDKPLGVGLNNFGIKINPPWQYSNHIEMHNPDDEDEKNGLVETIYLMIAAECGWHTLASYVFLLLYFYYLNILNFFRYRFSRLNFLPVALIGGLLAIYIESSLEWVLKQTNNFYQLMLVFALIAVMQKLYLAQNRRRSRSAVPEPALAL